jgi:hypothetical protein
MIKPRRDSEGNIIWYDEKMVIEKDMTGDYIEYFVHYDRKYVNARKNYNYITK